MSRTRPRCSNSSTILLRRLQSPLAPGAYDRQLRSTKSKIEHMRVLLRAHARARLSAARQTGTNAEKADSSSTEHVSRLTKIRPPLFYRSKEARAPSVDRIAARGGVSAPRPDEKKRSPSADISPGKKGHANRPARLPPFVDFLSPLLLFGTLFSPDDS
ncbi:hypothetical protein KM043_013777 [Ampulex compressa]|nr:hypothetical protein KM043_013777 [Ampulex compressa]